MALSKIVKTNNTEDNNPRLRKWGKIVSCRIFANSSSVDAGVKTALLNAVEAIRSGNERPEFCVESRRNVELLCYLPYVVGFACASGYLHRVQVDLSKPILFVFNSNSAVTGLVDATSYKQPSTRPQPPLLQSKGILTREELESGAHYKCNSLSESDIPDGMPSSNPDVVLCTSDCLSHLPRRGYSVVIVQDTWHPMLAGYQVHSSVLLLKQAASSPCNSPLPVNNEDEKCIEPPLINLADEIACGTRPMPKLLENQISGVEKMMDRVTDFNCSHIPIKLLMIGTEGLKEIVHALPYLLGSAAIRNSDCLDLHKPILFLTMDPEAHQLVLQCLPLFACGTKSDVNEPEVGGEGYRCFCLDSEFQIYTWSQQIKPADVLLHCISVAGNGSKKPAASGTLYEHFQSYELSALVLVQTKSLPQKEETDILCHFRGLTIVAVRANVNPERGDKEGSISVIPKLCTVQQCSADLINPTLMTHGKDITQRYLLCHESVLTDCQQVGLASLVEWLGSEKSCVEAATVRSAIGTKYAGMMIWCLPSMLEWADNNRLTPEGAVDLLKPLLVLCTSKVTLDELWNLVHSKKSFHQSCLFDCVARCSDGKILSHLVTDTSPDVDAKSLARQYKMVFSSTKLMHRLPDNAFSVVVVFHNCTIPGEEMDLVAKKFSGRSKMISFAASPLGTTKRFDLQSTADTILDNKDAQEYLEPKSTKAKTSEETFAWTYPTPKEELEAEEMSSVADNPNPTNCSDMTVEELVLEEFVLEELVLGDNVARDQRDSKSEAQSCHSDASHVLAEILPGTLEEEEVTREDQAFMQGDKEFIEGFPLEEQNSPAISSCCAGIANPRSDAVATEVGLEDSADDQPIPVNTPMEELCDSSEEPSRQFSCKNCQIKSGPSITTSSPNDTRLKDDEITSVSAASTLDLHQSCTEHDSADLSATRKAKKWSKFKKILCKCNPKKIRLKRRRNTLQDDTTNMTVEVREYENGDSHSTGIFACWGRRRRRRRRQRSYNNRPSGTVNSIEIKEDEGSDPAHSSSGNAVLTWSDPVTYLNPKKSAVRETFKAEAIVEARPCDDAASLSSVTWSEPSLDIISLTERENFDDNSPAQNTLCLGETENSYLPLSSVIHMEAMSNCWLDTSECTGGPSERDVTSTHRDTPAKENSVTGEIQDDFLPSLGVEELSTLSVSSVSRVKDVKLAGNAPRNQISKKKTTNGKLPSFRISIRHKKP